MLSHLANTAHTCTGECERFPFFKEFLPPLKLLNSIPAQAQKTFKNINITFTCIDVCEEFIAVGSNVGIVYLFDQKKEKLHRLRSDIPENPVTCVRIVVALECLVAFGSKNGYVAAFKVPFNENDQVEKYTVQGLHKTSITSITWAKNGIKFFTGDSHGIVVCTEIEHLEHLSRSYVIVQEPSYIVQLSYHNMVLLVSTLHRCLLYHCEKEKIFQVGQKDRKYPGNFGAVFFHSEGSTVAYASRPGQRLWKSDNEGVIIETVILKSIITDQHHSISFQREFSSKDILKDFQFGSLKVFDNKFILSWTKECIVLFHPESGTICSICGFEDIVDIAVSRDEIYILQGIRHLLRLSSREANWLNERETEAEEKKPSSLHKSGSELFLRNMQKSFTEDNPAPKFLNWVKRKFSDASALDHNENLDVSSRPDRAQTLTTDLPDMVQLDKDLTTLRLFDKDFIKEKPADLNSNSDDIVYQPKVKKKKKKKPKVPVVVLDDRVEVGEMDSHNLPNEKKVDQSVIIEVNDNITSSIEDTKDNLESEEKISVHDSENDTQTPTDEVNIVELSTEQNINHQNHSLQIESDAQKRLEDPRSVDDYYCPSDETIPDKVVPTEQPYFESSHEELNENMFDVTDIYSHSNYVSSETDKNPNVGPDTVDHNQKVDIVEDDDKEAMMSSSDSFKDIEFEDPKIGSDWVQYKGPETIISLSVTNRHVFCADNRNCLYVSNFPVLGLVWKKLMQPTEQISASPSETIIWVLYKGTVYAMEKSNFGSAQSKWIPFAQDVSAIAVYDDVGWYFSYGKLILMKNLSSDFPFDYPSNPIDCTQNLIQLACHEKVIWALSSDFKVFCWSDSIYSENKRWQEVRFPHIKTINMITFGHDGTVYLVDAKNNVWFHTGVKYSEPLGDDGTWEVEKSNYIYQPSNHFKSAVMKVVNNDLLSSLIYTQYPSLIAASEAGVWLCRQMDNNLYSNQKRIAGHRWDVMQSNGIVAAMKWGFLAAEGMVNNEGTMWCYTVNHELFCLTYKDGFTNLFNAEPPSGVVLRCLVPTEKCLWILSTDGQIFVRREISKKCPQGVWWHCLDLTQLAGSIIKKFFLEFHFCMRLHPKNK